MNKKKIEEEVIALVRDEKRNWHEGDVSLTEDISFYCRNIIKKARKNYFSVFTHPDDPITGRKKLFVPLTRDMVETTVKNIDLDTRDIQVKAKTPGSHMLAGLARMILRAKLDQIGFGQILNRTIRRCAVEGVAVLKHQRDGRNSTISIVENLNFFTDPYASFLNESVSNIEVNWLTEDEIKSYDWDNIDKAIRRNNYDKVENITEHSEIPYIEVTERWGLMPRKYVTGRDNDTDLIEGTIIISNLNYSPVVHLVEENTSGVRPYVEFRTKQYDGRWLGLGIPEDLFDLQAYANEIFNTRLNANRIKQIGLYEVRKGAGITQQMLNQLYSGGAIKVGKLGEDIRELRTTDTKPSSYKDEDEAYLWAQRMTGAWELGRGEALPASQPATTAVIQDRGMKSGFNLQQEELGFSISRFVENLFLPAVLDSLTEGEIVRVSDDPSFLNELDRMHIDSIVNQEIIKYHKRTNAYPEQNEIDKMRISFEERFRKMGNDRYLQVKKLLFNPKNILDHVDVYVTGETFNKAVLADQLNALLGTYSQIPGINLDITGIMRELLDVMGLSGERFIKRQEPNQMGQVNQMGQPNRGKGRTGNVSGEVQRVVTQEGVNAETNL